MSSVNFLDFIIEQGELKAGPDKIRAVVEWQTASEVSWLCKFVSTIHQGLQPNSSSINQTYLGKIEL